MPVVRQVHWIGVSAQVPVIAALALALHLAFHLDTPLSIFTGAVFYLIFCRAMRMTFTREHRKGMSAYHARRFQEAIPHFEASYRFFSAHPRIDAWRYVLFAAASANSYRTIALCNLATCYGLIGNGKRAMELYEQALREQPSCTLAEVGLTMLKSAAESGAKMD